MEKISHAKAEALLKKHSIPTPKQFLAKTEKQALAFSEKIGFPVVMKISSPDIIHKTDSGGIFMDIGNEGEARKAFRQITKAAKRKKARIEGVLIQEHLDGVEIIVGSKLDPQFGPVLMFGLGGIFVEVLKDVSFRLIPLERSDAREMIQEIRGFPVLEGARGRKPVDLQKLEDFILAVSRLVHKNPDIQELDMNPAFASHSGIKVSDVRILV